MTTNSNSRDPSSSNTNNKIRTALRKIPGLGAQTMKSTLENHVYRLKSDMDGHKVKIGIFRDAVLTDMKGQDKIAVQKALDIVILELDLYNYTPP